MTRPLLALVHGIRITEPESRLMSRWIRHLSRGLSDLPSRADIDMLYWVGAGNTYPGHPLEHFIRQLGDDLAGFILEMKNLESSDADGVDARLQAHPGGPELERRFLKAMALEFVRHGQTAVREAIEDGLIPMSGVSQPRGLAALASNSLRRLSRLILDEIHAYLYEPARRERICEEVFAQLEPQLTPGRSVALIGHSLGALIVLDLLATRAALGRPLALDLVVTMGNPLVFPALYERLPQPLLVVPGIRRWVNLTADHDVVAMGTDIGSLIQRCPETGVAVENLRFENTLGRWSLLESFHRAEGYLESQPLAEGLDKWLKEAEKT